MTRSNQSAESTQSVVFEVTKVDKATVVTWSDPSAESAQSVVFEVTKVDEQP
ncbi:hypothetical protein [Fontibacillus sp. BL9]|uniref:hypothetical protein n=1 Tax=Fontibacillus sp. BL9 TaxID=3389971 RepID=UPI00397A65EC